MRVLDLTIKDLKQLVRDWKSAIFLVVMPIVFTLLFGFVFSGAGGEEDPRLPVALIDQDGSAVSAHLFEMLEASPAVRPVAREAGDLAEVEEEVGGGDLIAAVVVPAGYGQQALQGEGQAPRLTLIVDAGSPAGQSAVNGVQASAARLMGAVQATHLAARAYEAQGGTAGEEFIQETLAAAAAAWQDPPVAVRAGSAAIAAADDARQQASPFAHTSAGIMVQFAIAGIMGAAEIMVLERKSGTLRRLLTTAMSRWQIILGHFITMFLMILAQFVLLILFGDLILGVDYLREPLAIGLVAVATALWAASLGLLVGVVARNEDQVIIMALLSMLILAGLGGAWMPLEFTGKTFQAVGHLTPTAWAIDGLENVTIRGLGLGAALLPAGILLGFAAVLAGIAAWRFRFE